MKQLIFSDLSADVTDFKQDLVTELQKKESWKGALTTQVGTTLIDFVASLGAYTQQSILNAYENSFSETANNDDAIRAIALMQGLRMTRKLPAHINVNISSTINFTIPAYSQFSCAGYSWFNRETITLTANTPINIVLYQGTVIIKQVSGIGTELQVWQSPETNFTVSDQDVKVAINNTFIPVSYSGLWNFYGKPACQDLTSLEGRLLIQFGNLQYGTNPDINDTVGIIYAVTEGNNGNNYETNTKEVTLDGFSGVLTAKATSNPIGGADEKTAYTYKNNTSASFGTYGSAVTKSQYQAIVNTYPGVIDSYTQSQREIDPTDLRFMNVIRVTGITNTPWDDTQKKDFCTWCQDQSMYSCRFIWVDALPMPVDVEVEVYCYNSSVLSAVKQNVENAIRSLFSARPGILMTDFYISDIISACRNSDSGISYVIVQSPTSEMIVTQANAPSVSYEILSGQGSLKEYFYSYGVTFVDSDGIESKKSSWVHPQLTEDNCSVRLTWRHNPSAVKYKIYGRTSENIGLLAEVDAGVTTYLDDGSASPDESKYSRSKDTIIRYNTLRSLKVTAYYADRQQRVTNQITTDLPYRTDTESLS